MEQNWQALGEIEVGDVWVSVAEHPSIERIDRTHCENRTTLGLWLSPHANVSQGCFLTQDWHGGHARLGTVVAIPGGIPFHVRSAASQERRMLHCRLPKRVEQLSASMSLEACLDLRNDIITASLIRLAREVVAPSFGTNAIVEGLGLVVSGELERSMTSQSRPRTNGGLAPWQLRCIDDYLKSGHWDSSVSDLASLCGVSPGHLMRAFRQSRGQSIAFHISVLRMDRACTLLAQHGPSIGCIASELRFASPSAFAAAFRRTIGMNPNAYRQRRRQ